MKTVDRPELARAGSVPAAVDHPAESELRTREAVVRLLQAESPLTAVAMAERLGISAAGIRRHLDHLHADGAVEAREAHAFGPRGRGRPAKAYVLTDIGRSRLPHGYDQLAVEALEYLAAHAGPEAVATFARARAERIVDGIRPQLAAAADIRARTELLAGALSEHGFSASTQQIGIGEQLCQHHCPVAHVAQRFPQLCEQELAVITEALGTYAQRLATIANGDSFCTTFIPLARLGGIHGDIDNPTVATDQPIVASAPSSGRTFS